MEKNLLSNLFCSHKNQKIVYNFIFELVKKKNQATLQPIPCPGSRGQKAPDPGYGSATLSREYVLWRACAMCMILIHEAPPLLKSPGFEKFVISWAHTVPNYDRNVQNSLPRVFSRCKYVMPHAFTSSASYGIDPDPSLDLLKKSSNWRMVFKYT